MRMRGSRQMCQHMAFLAAPHAVHHACPKKRTFLQRNNREVWDTCFRYPRPETLDKGTLHPKP